MKMANYMLSGLLLLLSFAFLACNSENEEDILPGEELCQDNTATLSGAVSTIIETNCAVSGCHVSGTGRVNFTVSENIIQNATQIRNFTQAGIMPPPESGGSLTAQEKMDIRCWVENGAQDN